MNTSNCRDCGGVVSKRAKTCPHCGAPNPPADGNEDFVGKGLVAIVIVAVITYIICREPSPHRGTQLTELESTTAPSTAPTNDPASGSQRSTERHLLVAGQVGVLRQGRAQSVLVAVSMNDLERMTQLQLANDNEGVAGMILTGRVMMVDAGTKCRVIDNGILTDEIRILDGPCRLRSGFVPVEFVKGTD